MGDSFLKNPAGPCGWWSRAEKPVLTAQYGCTYYSQLMARPSLRNQILRAGLPVMFRSGYHAASVRDICRAAGAPQGSFTNHFRSKERFAAEVLEQYRS